MKKGVVDIGNTRIKCAAFNEDGTIADRFFTDNRDEAFRWMHEQGVRKLLLASVGHDRSADHEKFDIVTLSSGSSLPFVNLYTTPQTLGADRIAAMAAAAVFYPGQAVLVFDIGTCMTIDLLHPDNTYRGGNISPGLNMRFRVLHEMTGRLPLVSPADYSGDPGTHTAGAIAAGVIRGMQHEIEGYIRTWQDRYPDLKVVFCGGDHGRFVLPDKTGIFAAPDWVLSGMYQLLLLNES